MAASGVSELACTEHREIGGMLIVTGRSDDSVMAEKMKMGQRETAGETWGR